MSAERRGLSRPESIVSRQVVKLIHAPVSRDCYPIAAQISCVVVDTNGVDDCLIDSALE